MKPLRFIKIGLIILASAFAFVVGIWFLLMLFYNPAMLLGVTSQNFYRPVSPSDTVEETESNQEAASQVANDSPVTIPAEGITIDTSGLPASQKSMLATFGFTGDSIYFSAAAITCARTAVGEQRFAEIVAGALPGPLEATKLYQCTKR